jgi:hypothetical protein
VYEKNRAGFYPRFSPACRGMAAQPAGLKIQAFLFCGFVVSFL